MSKVMVHPASYESVREAIDRAFQLFPLQLRGKKVLIKPNVLRASEATEGIVTHPAALRAVVEAAPVSINGQCPHCLCLTASRRWSRHLH